MRRLVALALFVCLVAPVGAETVYRPGQRVKLAITGLAFELPGPSAGWDVYSVGAAPTGKAEDAYDVIALHGGAKLLVDVRFVEAKTCDDWRKTYVPDGATANEDVAYWPHELGEAGNRAVFEKRSDAGWISAGCEATPRGAFEAVIYSDVAPTKPQTTLLLKLTTAMISAANVAPNIEVVATPTELDDVIGDLRGTRPLTATIATSQGTLTCKLFDQKAPIAVANFVGLARGKKAFLDPKQNRWVQRPFYDGLTIHRVIPGFVIQGGDLAGDGTGRIGYTIKNEDGNGLVFDRPGKLATARDGNPDSADGQFFITDGAAPHLSGHQTIFGECGPLSTIHALASVPHNASDRPERPIKITSVKITR
jgi:cyclophilin family peptidyl-prolyl cis-trans isomerase